MFDQCYLFMRAEKVGFLQVASFPGKRRKTETEKLNNQLETDAECNLNGSDVKNHPCTIYEGQRFHSIEWEFVKAEWKIMLLLKNEVWCIFNAGLQQCTVKGVLNNLFLFPPCLNKAGIKAWEVLSSKLRHGFHLFFMMSWHKSFDHKLKQCCFSPQYAECYNTPMYMESYIWPETCHPEGLSWCAQVWPISYLSQSEKAVPAIWISMFSSFVRSFILITSILCL